MRATWAQTSLLVVESSVDRIWNRPHIVEMVESEHQGIAGVDAGTRVKGWLSRALFPVSAGAVAAEIATVLAMSLSVGATNQISTWAGLAAAAAALLFQISTRKKH